jgi:hypothetical protein
MKSSRFAKSDYCTEVSQLSIRRLTTPLFHGIMVAWQPATLFLSVALSPLNQPDTLGNVTNPLLLV